MILDGVVRICTVSFKIAHHLFDYVTNATQRLQPPCYDRASGSTAHRLLVSWRTGAAAWSHTTRTVGQGSHNQKK